MFVFSYSCQEGETKELWSSGHHLKACRAVVFSEDGQKLVTVSKDKAIHFLDVEQGRLENAFPKLMGLLSTVCCWWMRMFWPLGMTQVGSGFGTSGRRAP